MKGITRGICELCGKEGSLALRGVRRENSTVYDNLRICIPCERKQAFNSHSHVFGGKHPLSKRHILTPRYQTI